jgi:hypothetical protein
MSSPVHLVIGAAGATADGSATTTTEATMHTEVSTLRTFQVGINEVLVIAPPVRVIGVLALGDIQCRFGGDHTLSVKSK